MTTGVRSTVTELCYHCGEKCDAETISFDDKLFCCEGCKLVFQILQENGLCNYYSIENSPGISQKSAIPTKRFEFLDDETIQRRLIDFQEAEYTKVTFFVPSMHCSSCIWLLENLHRIHSGIRQSQVNFLQRRVSIAFTRNEISLKGVVELLSSIGYEPKINLDDMERTAEKHLQRSMYYKIGIAGFAFGNIMLLTFPEYLAIDASSLALKELFSWLIFIISLPVFFYCSSEYFISAYKSLRSGTINIDVPLALGITAFYARSVTEIALHIGPGYMDSFTGLIFFLLIGRIFQNKTFDLLNFERNYKSYFPIAVNVPEGNGERSIPLANLNIGDRFYIKNNELIPVDSVLIKGIAQIDYSFITGESVPVTKQAGEFIYAGGKQLGGLLELTATKNVSQSYLTQLWNESALRKDLKRTITDFSSTVAKYFTYVLLFISAGAGVYWLQTSWQTSLAVISTILIIACPCALALSSPFALGNALRILSRNEFYVKNIRIIEALTKINAIVFDKTGTITHADEGELRFQGGELTEYDHSLLRSLAKNSTHPLSVQLSRLRRGTDTLAVDSFTEVEGAGIEGFVDGHYIRIGSARYTGGQKDDIELSAGGFTSSVFLAIDNEVKGSFTIRQQYRSGISKLMELLAQKAHLTILSGDSERERSRLQEIVGEQVSIYFEQNPFQKLEFIKSLQAENRTVLMVGDGLNDSGALKQSNAAISVTENTLNFTPASDGIVSGEALPRLNDFLSYAGDAMLAIKMSFCVSLVYNVIGIYYACIGKITPLFAAILMPISSVTVIVLTVVTTTIFAKRRKLLT